MKVIKEGRQQTGWSQECTCTGAGNGGGGCGAVLLVEFSDLFHTRRSSYDGDTEYFTTFKCMQCRVLTDITGSFSWRARDLPFQKVWESRQEDGTRVD